MDARSAADEVGGSGTVPPPPTFDVLISDTGAGVLVRLDGELDVETASWFLTELSGSLTAGQAREVELDLSGLTFLDVAGVRALVRAHDQMMRDGWRVHVRGLDETRLPAARVLGLGRHFEARSSGRDEGG
jgi:anti-sigma B factor antagonist